MRVNFQTMFLLKKIFKSKGHRPNNLGALILLRNILKYKNFYSLRSNLHNLIFLNKKKITSSYSYVEIGTGYTISDYLLLNYHFNFKGAVLSDINKLIYPRLYSFFMICCPLNYFAKEFWFYLPFFIKTIFIGWKCLNKNNIYYSNKIILDKKSKCFIYSNAVLEHLNKSDINKLFIKISSLEKYIFTGIIDTNDHLFVNHSSNKHFRDFIEDDMYFQIRGNNINFILWKKIFREYFNYYNLKRMGKKGPLSRVLYFYSQND